jgi:hypothetical protein
VNTSKTAEKRRLRAANDIGKVFGAEKIFRQQQENRMQENQSWALDPRAMEMLMTNSRRGTGKRQLQPC